MIRMVVVYCLVCSLMACGGMIRNGGIHEAQNALNKGDFSQALEYTDIVESFGSLSSQKTAKLHFLRAQAQAGLGMRTEATESYRYVIKHHSNSAYAEPSQRRLDELLAN